MDHGHSGDVVVVAARGDAAAVALVTGLRRRGRRALLVDETAVVSARLEHRPASGRTDPGGPGTGALPGDVLRLASGYPVGPATGAVVWRLDGFPVAQLPPEHHEYAECEGFAAGLSWLTGLGEVALNRPDPLGLAGARVDLLGLHRLAAWCGLSVPAFELRSNDAAAGRPPTALLTAQWEPPGLPDAAVPVPAATGPRLPRPAFRVEPVVRERPVLVLEDEVVGPDRTTAVTSAPAIARLVAAAGLRCGEVGLGRSRSGRLVVTGLSPIPSLRQPGHLAALTDYLEQRVGARTAGVAA